MEKKPSLYGNERECFLCHDTNVHKHHIFFGSGRRSISDDEGCWVYLCPMHHNMSDFGVHFDKSLDMFFKEDCQRWWEGREGLKEPEHETFRARFHGSYL